MTVSTKATCLLHHSCKTPVKSLSLSGVERSGGDLAEEAGQGGEAAEPAAPRGEPGAGEEAGAQPPPLHHVDRHQAHRDTEAVGDQGDQVGLGHHVQDMR